MYQKLNIPVLGIIENMSYFVCPTCAARERHLRARRRREDGGGAGGAVPRPDPDLPADPGGRRHGRPLVVSANPIRRPRARSSAAAEQTAAQVSIASYRKPRHPADAHHESSDRGSGIRGSGIKDYECQGPDLVHPLRAGASQSRRGSGPARAPGTPTASRPPAASAGMSLMLSHRQQVAAGRSPPSAPCRHRSPL